LEGARIYLSSNGRLPFVGLVGGLALSGLSGLYCLDLGILSSRSLGLALLRLSGLYRLGLSSLSSRGLRLALGLVNRRNLRCSIGLGSSSSFRSRNIGRVISRRLLNRLSRGGLNGLFLSRGLGNGFGLDLGRRLWGGFGLDLRYGLGGFRFDCGFLGLVRLGQFLCRSGSLCFGRGRLFSFRLGLGGLLSGLFSRGGLGRGLLFLSDFLDGGVLLSIPIYQSVFYRNQTTNMDLVPGYYLLNRLLVNLRRLLRSRGILSGSIASLNRSGGVLL
jgi:hypothetical protein